MSYLFYERVSQCGPDWPWTLDPSASVFTTWYSRCIPLCPTPMVLEHVHISNPPLPYIWTQASHVPFCFQNIISDFKHLKHLHLEEPISKTTMLTITEQANKGIKVKELAIQGCYQNPIPRAPMKTGVLLQGPQSCHLTSTCSPWYSYVDSTYTHCFKIHGTSHFSGF